MNTPRLETELATARARAENAESVLKKIAEMTDPDNETSYRCDDREGCLDAVHAICAAKGRSDSKPEDSDLLAILFDCQNGKMTCRKAVERISEHFTNR